MGTRFRYRKRSVCAGCGRVMRRDGGAFCRRCLAADPRLPPIGEPVKTVRPIASQSVKRGDG